MKSSNTPSDIQSVTKRLGANKTAYLSMKNKGKNIKNKNFSYKKIRSFPYIMPYLRFSKIQGDKVSRKKIKS